MFNRISLRTSPALDTAIRTETQMANKGAGGRIIYAAVAGACSLLWLHPLLACGYVGLIAFWERIGRPWTTSHAIALLSDRRPLLRAYHRTIVLVAACLYATAPLTGILSGQLVGWYMAMMAFCGAIIAGITYFSNDKWLFAACTGPSFLVAAAAPFAFGVPAQVAMVVCTLNVMFVLSALQSAVHRAELVESVTKEEAARSKAESANVEKSQFIANISHELRTPLNDIIGYSEMMREAADEEARVTDSADLDKVLSASRGLLVLVNDLLDISKIEAGKLSLNVGWYDVGEMIETSLDMARPHLAAHGASLHVSIDPSVGQGVSDEYRLGQCVLNLVTNAATLTRGETINLTAKRERSHGGDWFVIEVSHHNSTLQVETIERLFQPFTQNDELSMRQYGGASLGLAITRRIARLLGGDVVVREADGGGLAFVLTTPVVARVSVECVAPDAADTREAAA